MNAPRYIQDELKLIDSRYFAVFDPLPRVCGNGAEVPLFVDKQGRWLIRKWKSVHPIDQRLNTWRFNSTDILTVKETDDEDNDMGFHALDRRVLDAMKMGFYWARNAKQLLQDIDKSNEDMEAKEEAEEDYIHRYGAKMIWRRYREPRIFLGG